MFYQVRLGQVMFDAHVALDVGIVVLMSEVV
jgi:hypothetical protein